MTRGVDCCTFTEEEELRHMVSTLTMPDGDSLWLKSSASVCVTSDQHIPAQLQDPADSSHPVVCIGCATVSMPERAVSADLWCGSKHVQTVSTPE